MLCLRLAGCAFRFRWRAVCLAQPSPRYLAGDFETLRLKVLQELAEKLKTKNIDPLELADKSITALLGLLGERISRGEQTKAAKAEKLADILKREGEDALCMRALEAAAKTQEEHRAGKMDKLRMLKGKDPLGKDSDEDL